MRVVQVLQKALVACACIALVATSSATAQTSGGDYKPLDRIGTTAAFSPQRPLTNAASIKTFATMRGIPDDIRKVLRDAGIPELADGVITALTGATTSVRGGSCSDATPEEGRHRRM
jgi:hypothetical protein